MYKRLSDAQDATEAETRRRQEAERALADARARRVSVLRQYHLDQAALDRLTGRQAGLTQTQSAETRQ